jgi:hypothetical protein
MIRYDTAMKLLCFSKRIVSLSDTCVFMYDYKGLYKIPMYNNQEFVVFWDLNDIDRLWSHNVSLPSFIYCSGTW